MSRNLPPHPNLEHLKKQAKELLHDLKQQYPASKLADAQHTLARDYGFASWPKLKAYVESLSRAVKPAKLQLAFASETANPFAGKWTANLAKSQRHPGNPFQSATLEFIVEDDTLTIIDVVVDDSGHENLGKNIILVDGNEHPSENGDGYVLEAKWHGSHVIETVAKKDGQVVGWGTYQVSNDGKTLTIRGDRQTILLDRN